MKTVFFIVLFWMMAVSVFTFFLCGKDKLAAKSNHRRTPEKRFFLLAISGGALGLFFGMIFFNHKTRHASFVFVTICGAVIWGTILLMLGIKCLF